MRRLRLGRQASVELARLAKMCGLVERCRVAKNVCWLAGASSHALSWPDNRSSLNGVHFFDGGAGRMRVGTHVL